MDTKNIDEFTNKRNLRRHYLIYYLRAFNRDNGDIIGYLVDITTRGIMLMRDSPLEIGKEYSMRLRWRNSDGQLQIADFTGLCRWCKRDVNPDFYGVGFSITPANVEHIKNISRLINDLSMPEAPIDETE